MTDFVALCRAARHAPGPETNDQLWRAWFALPAWHMIAAPSPVGTLPFSNFIDGGQRCVFAFTTYAAADAYARSLRVGPLMAVAPEQVVHRVPVLKRFGVTGFLVDIGPDGFHTTLDLLSWMFYRFRAPEPAAPPPQPAAQPLTVDALLRLPAWQLVVSKADPGMPDLATHGSDLIARIYSSPQAAARFARGASIVAMSPAQVLELLVDLELVRAVQFDNELPIDLVDLKLRMHR